MEGGPKLGKGIALILVIVCIGLLMNRSSQRKKLAGPAATSPVMNQLPKKDRFKRQQSPSEGLTDASKVRIAHDALTRQAIAARSLNQTATKGSPLTQFVKEYTRQATPKSYSPALAYQATTLFQMTGDKKYLNDANTYMNNFVTRSESSTADQKSELYAAHINEIAAVYQMAPGINQGDQAWFKSVGSYLTSNDPHLRQRLQRR